MIGGRLPKDRPSFSGKRDNKPMSDNREFDAREFRNALGAFATGVTVVTTAAPDGSRAGVTANSFNSVSLDPPMILWSLARSSRNLATFELAPYWAVHILAADQDHLSNHFAKSSADKFVGLEIETGMGGIPLLKDYATRLQCKTAFKYEGGDHVIFVGEVLSFDRRDVAPLVFHGGKYALAARKTEPAVLSGTSPRDSDISFGEDFLGYLLWRAAQHFQSRVTPHLQAQGLVPDTFMILAMLLHRDARSPKQLAAGIPPPAAANIEALLGTLSARGLLTSADGPAGKEIRLSAEGRAVTLLIHAASKAIEADLLGRLEPGEAMALKHLIRRFIVQTDTGLPHPWQSEA
jgi:3-hydroxy-9,10-secoandrosta-1,3,5(10)-triene-9,17-dione monooxygenase reductase component